jgi:hypothetical protein
MKRLISTSKNQRLARITILMIMVCGLVALSFQPSLAASLMANNPGLIASGLNLANPSTNNSTLLAGDCPPSSYSLDDIQLLGTTGNPSPLINDTRTLPLDELSKLISKAPAFAGSGSLAPGPGDTSVYMSGKVAVGIILPESNGSGENWTDAMKACLVESARQRGSQP